MVPKRKGVLLTKAWGLCKGRLYESISNWEVVVERKKGQEGKDWFKGQGETT